jgi:hypothetical protein
MRRLIGSAQLGLVLALLPTLAAAQRRAAAPMESGAEHEIGVDLAFQFIDRGSGVGGGIQLGAPVDVRLGFLSKSDVMFEARAFMAWDTKGAGTGATLLFSPGMNILYQLRRGTGMHGLMRAPYLTGGVGINFISAPGFSETQFAIGGGVGTRLPYGNAVFRPEGFLLYAFSAGVIPSAWSIGTRIGLSFWH